ncbi:hypothetical protein E2C01_017930 [Portunus trituberculatus]|uniref:Uncharacterized protein n=1 Tax=Portunus trituberculatus TaxID=210409 RepID=A0A5B7DV52_PORTR|nr:hypothetical protein [Portunus trituberculatus]
MPIYDGEGMKLLLLGSCGPNKITQIHRPLGVQYTSAADSLHCDPGGGDHPLLDNPTPALTCQEPRTHCVIVFHGARFSRFCCADVL